MANNFTDDHLGAARARDWPVSAALMLLCCYGPLPMQAIHAAAKLGLPDILGDEPRTAEELAAASHAHAPSLHRLLRALAAMAIFEEDDEGRFRHTELSRVLRSDHPQSARPMCLIQGSLFWASNSDLHQTVVTGRPAFPRLHGVGFFDYLSAHPDLSAQFQAAMSASAVLSTAAVRDAIDFSVFPRIVDVGGGQGTLLEALLTANPGLHGVLYDHPTVIERADRLRTGPLANRCEVVGGDFFERVPEGGDAYIMKWILHDWSDDECVTILRNCRRAITPNGRVLIVDSVLAPPNTPDPVRFMDLLMLSILPGRERAEAEFGPLLSKAGFTLTRVVPTPSPWSIVEGAPAS